MGQLLSISENWLLPQSSCLVHSNTFSIRMCCWQRATTRLNHNVVPTVDAPPPRPLPMVKGADERFHGAPGDASEKPPKSIDNRQRTTGGAHAEFLQY